MRARRTPADFRTETPCARSLSTPFPRGAPHAGAQAVVIRGVPHAADGDAYGEGKGEGFSHEHWHWNEDGYEDGYSYSYGLGLGGLHPHRSAIPCRMDSPGIEVQDRALFFCAWALSAWSVKRPRRRGFPGKTFGQCDRWRRRHRSRNLLPRWRTPGRYRLSVRSCSGRTLEA